MKINIITYDNGYGLSGDILILKSYLEQLNLKELYLNHIKLKDENEDENENLDIKVYNFYDYKCRECDINIYLEIYNNLLLKYAKINILIPNQEWYYKNWICYLNNFDYILTKTHYATNIFNTLVNKDKVKYIGWTSKDRFSTNYITSFTNSTIKCLHLCGRSKYKQTQTIIDNWDLDFYPLTVVYSEKDIKLIKKEQKNIIYINNKLSELQINKLFNTHLIHICCSQTEGFGHYINEAKSCHKIILTTNSPPMNELINDTNGILINCSLSKKLEHTLGEYFLIDTNDFKEKMRNLKNINQNTLTQMLLKINENENESFFYKNIIINSRESYINTQNEFKERFENVFKDIFKKIFDLENDNKNENINENKNDNENKDKDKEFNYPNISIITLVYNRKRFFKLSKLNFFGSDYPKEKLEWIIIDDSKEEEKVRDLIPNDKNIKYLEYNTHLCIGEKRNIAIENSTYDYICFMDDDDYYKSSSIKYRIENLINNNKSCVLCSTIACFHINKFISIINVPPHQLPFESRVSEASMLFKKSFWEKQKFKNSSNGSEGKEFIENRYEECLELNWESIFVSLMHSSNTSDKITFINQPNGCHFNFSDKLFEFLTSLDK